MLFVTSGDGAEVFELAEEPLDDIPITVEEAAEGGHVRPCRHWFDAGPAAFLLHPPSQSVAVIGGVGEQDLAFAKIVQHVLGASAVMGLTGRELQLHWQAVRIDEGVDLGSQAAP